MGTQRYDVVVLGGALAGASAALLLRRRHPGLQVLVVEKRSEFDYKVGESTVEASSYFLTRILRLWDHLSREQLPKHGLRYWFHNERVRTPAEASEVGPCQLPRLGTFQLDRSKLDAYVLDRAVSEGAQLWRPARVVEVELPQERGRREGRVRVERGGRTVEVEAGWILDATGRSAILARRRGWLHRIQDHPTSAVWARYQGVQDLDGPELAGGDPGGSFERATLASRRLATNHFNGYGYWIWFIPLKGGQTSIGVVWDRRIVEPQGEGAAERLQWFLDRNPLAGALSRGAQRVPGDLHSYAHLPYRVDRVVGLGWSLVGDAAGFLDPFYSPGLDQLAFSVSWALEHIPKGLAAVDPAALEAELEAHNEGYARFFRGFFEAIYADKYYLMGDYDTMTASFLMDTALYYMFVIWPMYKTGGSGPLVPPFYRRASEVAVALIRTYRRRLVSIARRRMKLGLYGHRNGGRRPKIQGFTLGATTVQLLLQGVARWIQAEAENGWTYVVAPHRKADAAGAPVSS